MPTFIDKPIASHNDPCMDYYNLHLGRKVPLVEEDDIHHGAIHSENIAPGAVTNDKIAPGAVGHEQLAPEAITELSGLETELEGLARDISNKIRDAEAVARDIAELKGAINEEFTELLPFILKGGYKVVNINSNIVSSELPPEGTEVDVIFVNTSHHEITVTIPSSSYRTPLGADIVLLVPVGGYAEANFVNVEGTVYVRGV